MATTHTQIPDIQIAQSQKEVTANQAHDLLDKQLNQLLSIVVTGDFTLTANEMRENAVLELTGTPGAPFTMDMFDTNERLIRVTNNTDDVATVRNSAGAGSDQPVIAVGDTVTFHYDGTDFISLAAPGGGSDLEVKDEGSTVVASATAMNFIGAGVDVADGGGGQANITIPGGGGAGASTVIAALRHRGAFLTLSADIAGHTSTSAIPWNVSIYDTKFDPGDGGLEQRLWLGIDQTFVDGDVTTGIDQINIAGHGFVTGEGPVRLSSSGTLPAGLATATDYWIERVDDDNLKFATSRANAIAGTAVDITTAAGGGTHTVETETWFVVPAGVTKARFTGAVDSASDLTGQLVVTLGKNDTTIFDGAATSGVETAGTEQANIVSAVLEVSEGDRFELNDFFADTGTINADAGKTWFSMEIVEADPVDDLGLENLLVNGDFRVAQRGTVFTAATTPANDDDTYLLDRWVFLADGTDIADITQETTIVPSGAKAAMKALVATANAKFGFVQIIEGKDAAKIIGRKTSLQFKARTTTGAAIRNIRAAVLSWTSTEDAVTSDVISAWAIEGTNPTFAANWTAENVAVDLALVVDMWTTFTIEDIAIDAGSATNVAVVIWVNDTDAALNDELFIADVKLNLGSVTTGYEMRSFAEELALCQRYALVLGTDNIAGSAYGIGSIFSTTAIDIILSYPVTMRAVPTFSASTASDFSVVSAGSSFIATDIAISSSALINTHSVGIRATVASGLIAGDAGLVRSQTVNAKFTFDAEL